MNLSSLTASTDLIWAAANDALDLESLDDNQVRTLVDVACLLLMRRAERHSLIDSPAAARELIRTWIGMEPNEVFGAMYMDTQHRIMESVIHFYGTIDSASVHPRAIVQKALELGCASVIFCHNHPSGIAEPSMADQQLTDVLIKALKLVDVRVLDHLVVGEKVISMAERGLL